MNWLTLSMDSTTKPINLHDESIESVIGRYWKRKGALFQATIDSYLPATARPRKSRCHLRLDPKWCVPVPPRESDLIAEKDTKKSPGIAGIWGFPCGVPPARWMV